MKLWKTLKTMSFMEGIDYIWEYYKLHLFGITLAIIILGSIISTILKEDEELYNMMVVSEIPNEEINMLADQMNDNFFDQFQVTTDSISHNEGDLANQSPEQVQKFYAKIAAGMVDVVVTDKEFAANLIEQGGLAPIDQLAELNTLEKHNVELYEFDTGEFYGIGTNQLAVFKERELFQDRVLIFPTNSRNKERTEVFLEELLLP